jgi:hypothetical protein
MGGRGGGRQQSYGQSSHRQQAVNQVPSLRQPQHNPRAPVWTPSNPDMMYR